MSTDPRLVESAAPQSMGCGHECFQCAKDELARATDKLTRLTEALAGTHQEPAVPLLSIAAAHQEPAVPLLSMEDAAVVMGVHRDTVTKAIKARLIKAEKRPNARGRLAWNISRADAEAYAERNK